MSSACKYRQLTKTRLALSTNSAPLPRPSSSHFPSTSGTFLPQTLNQTERGKRELGKHPFSPHLHPTESPLNFGRMWPGGCVSASRVGTTSQNICPHLSFSDLILRETPVWKPEGKPPFLGSILPLKVTQVSTALGFAVCLAFFFSHSVPCHCPLESHAHPYNSPLCV